MLLISWVWWSRFVPPRRAWPRHSQLFCWNQKNRFPSPSLARRKNESKKRRDSKRRRQKERRTGRNTICRESAQYSINIALSSFKRVLRPIKKAQHFFKEPYILSEHQYSIKRALSSIRKALFSAKLAIWSIKTASFSTKEPYFREFNMRVVSS